MKDKKTAAHGAKDKREETEKDLDDQLAVLFKGTTDLGEQDGGVFDWVGRATDDQFVGFYTSGHYTGVFSLKRVKKTT